MNDTHDLLQSLKTCHLYITKLIESQKSKVTEVETDAKDIMSIFEFCYWCLKNAVMDVKTYDDYLNIHSMIHAVFEDCELAQKESFSWDMDAVDNAIARNTCAKMMRLLGSFKERLLNNDLHR